MGNNGMDAACGTLNASMRMDLTVTEEWSWKTHQIISIPVVANLDATGAPEVVVNITHQDGGDFPIGKLRAEVRTSLRDSTNRSNQF